MKGIFKPIDYRTHEQNTSHIHYGKAVTILGKDKLGYCFSIDDFPNCNHREKQNRFHAGYEEIEIIDHPTEKGGEEWWLNCYRVRFAEHCQNLNMETAYKSTGTLVKTKNALVSR